LNIDSDWWRYGIMDPRIKSEDDAKVNEKGFPVLSGRAGYFLSQQFVILGLDPISANL
jgi:hypothetical protein